MLCNNLCSKLKESLGLLAWISVVSSESDESSSDSNSDSSWKSFSQITSDDDFSCDSSSGDQESVSSCDDEHFPDLSNTTPPPQQAETSTTQISSSHLHHQGSFTIDCGVIYIYTFYLGKWKKRATF